MELSKSNYWEDRIQERFKPVHGLETELTRVYSTAYKTIYDDYFSIVKPYLNSDSTIDYHKLETALKFDSGVNRKFSRYQMLLNRVDEITTSIGTTEVMSIEELLMNTYKTNYYDVLYHLEGDYGYKTEFALLSKDRLRQVIHTKWSEDGKEFSDRIWNNKRLLSMNLKNLLQDGIATGKSPLQTANLLKDVTHNSLSNCKRIIRTETMAIITNSDNAAYTELGFSKYTILAAFDKRTSRICQEQDGKEYLLREMKIGTNAPPFHPHCRSTTEPVMANISAIRFAKNIDGKRVAIPSNMTFADFKKIHLVPQG